MTARNREFWFFFSASLSVPWGETEGNIEVEWKQIPLFHAGPVIKCFVIPPDSKLEKTCLTSHLRCLGPQYERQSKPSCLSEWHDGVFFFATNTMLKLKQYLNCFGFSYDLTREFWVTFDLTRNNIICSQWQTIFLPGDSDRRALLCSSNSREPLRSSVCFYICFYISSLSLEVIKIFQVNKSASHRFLLRCSKPENFVQFALGNCRKLTPEFLVEWEAPIISKNENNLLRYTHIFEKFLLEIPFYLIFIQDFLVEWYASRNISSFRIFQETYELFFPISEFFVWMLIGFAVSELFYLGFKMSIFFIHCDLK